MRLRPLFHNTAKLPAFVALVFTIAAHVHAQAPLKKEAFLRQTADSVLQPAYARLRDRCHELEQAAADLSAGPTLAALKKTQAAWSDAMLASRNVQCYLAGPIVDRDAAASFFYSRIFPGRIEAAINSSHPINAAWIDEMGATTKGLFACEYLLFEPARPSSVDAKAPPRKLEMLDGTNALRRAEFLVALTHDLAQKAGTLASDWSKPGEDSPGGRFAAGGQETLNFVINQMAMSLENIAEEHLNLVLQLPQPIARQLDRIENSRSGASLSALSARLAGLRELYRGGAGAGIDDYLRQLNVALHARVEQRFNVATDALRSVGVPLEIAVTTHRDSIQRAYNAVLEMELLFKVDMASTLGVTITFNSNDGD